MKCGNCKKPHATVADVRSCYNGGPAQKTATAHRDLGDPGTDLPFPSGRYAILDGGECKFYSVESVTEGRWAGHHFVKVQAGDDFHSIKNKDTRRRILAAIAEDPETAMIMYGQELGVCGMCSKTLTKRKSRERGIGPKCARKLGL